MLQPHHLGAIVYGSARSSITSSRFPRPLSNREVQRGQDSVWILNFSAAAGPLVHSSLLYCSSIYRHTFWSMRDKATMDLESLPSRQDGLCNPTQITYQSQGYGSLYFRSCLQLVCSALTPLWRQGSGRLAFGLAPTVLPPSNSSCFSSLAGASRNNLILHRRLRNVHNSHDYVVVLNPDLKVANK
jgi:hypothetical protein